MTREELRDYVDEQRTLGNIPYHVYTALIDGIDTLEQEPILDKIDKIYNREGNSFDCLNALDELKEFIDKYKAESEDKEDGKV